MRRNERPSGAKAHVPFAPFSARLKSCPFTKQRQIWRKSGLRPRPTNRALSRPNPIKQLLDRILDVVGAEAEAAHSAYEGCGAGDGESDEVAFVGARVDDHAGFDSCEGSAFVLGDAELGFDDGVGVESGVDGLEQGFEAFAGEGGERDLGTFTVGSGAGAGGAFTFWTGVCAREQGRALIFWEQVDFVEHFDARLGETFKLAENFFDLRLLFFAVGGRGVADVEQHLGLRHFFERGAEAGDQGVGQVADEADGVREEDLAAAGQLEGAEFGIESGKHARGCEDPGAGERVEERALAGVGVSDQGDGGDGNGLAALALLLADAADGVEVELELVDAALDLAPVGFKLGFAGAAGADAAAELGHGFAAAGEAREHVFKLREFDLELALAGAGVAGEDVEDQLGSVEDAAGKRGLEIAQLGGREVVVEENQIGLDGRGQGSDLLDLAGTDESGRIGTGTALEQLGGDLGSGA